MGEWWGKHLFVLHAQHPISLLSVNISYVVHLLVYTILMVSFRKILPFSPSLPATAAATTTITATTTSTHTHNISAQTIMVS